MSLKIKISYTDEAELSRYLAPLNMRLKLPKKPPKGPFKCAYLTSRNDGKADKKGV